MMESKSNHTLIKHLYSRAGFGIRYAELQERNNWNLKKAVDDLFKVSKTVTPLDINLDADLRPKGRELSEQERRELQRKARLAVRELNTSWLVKMAESPSQLREKMTLFWHGHFACRTQNPVFAQQLNNIQREHALGNFRTLLLGVSRSPAMLQFLNNQQNRKGHPNENFARELMELFTLGRGNYTEDDVKEAARAFTGWGFNLKGEFQFRPMVHDDGRKAFLGKTGNFGGEEIIDIILQKREAAHFITRKICTYFVNDAPDERKVKEFGDYFYSENYDIGALVSKIFTSDWFYNPANVGNKIKSPAEFLVGLTRQFHVHYNNPAVLFQFQSALGQVLFYPPNVAGWPGGKAWIDSSSLMVRLKIPSLVLNSGIIDFDGKTDPDDEALLAMSRLQRRVVERRVQAQADWERFIKEFPANTKPSDLAGFILQPAANPAVINMLKTTVNLKSAAIELVSMPEYQLA